MTAVAFAVRIVGIHSFGEAHIKFFRFVFADLLKIFQRKGVEVDKIAFVISGGFLGGGDVAVIGSAVEWFTACFIEITPDCLGADHRDRSFGTGFVNVFFQIFLIKSIAGSVPDGIFMMTGIIVTELDDDKITRFDFSHDFLPESGAKIIRPPAPVA